METELALPKFPKVFGERDSLYENTNAADDQGPADAKDEAFLREKKNFLGLPPPKENFKKVRTTSKMQWI